MKTITVTFYSVPAYSQFFLQYTEVFDSMGLRVSEWVKNDVLSI